MAELNAVINLRDNFSAQIKTAIGNTDNFKDAVVMAKKELDRMSNAKYEATIKAKDEATKQISNTKRALNSIKTNVAITIAARDKATESVTKIKSELKKLVATPANIVINAIDKTKSVIGTITDSIFNLKTLAAGIVFGAAGKAGYEWTIGNASSNEDYLATLQTVLHSEEKGTEALKWAYQNAASTPFDAEEVVSGVTMLSTSGLDYTKYLNPLGDAASAMNKPIEQAIFAMGKLASGQNGVAVDMFRDFGVSNQDWTKAGASFSKNGELLIDDPQKAVDMVTEIIKSKYGGLMERKSGTANGMLSNMGDTIAGMGRGLAGIDDNGQMMEGGLFDNFKKQLAVIAPLLEQIQGSDAFKALQTQIGNLATIGGNKLTEFLNGFKDPEKIEQYKQSFNDFIAGAKEGIETLKQLGKTVKVILDIMKPVIDLIAAHPNLFGTLFVGYQGGKVVMSIFGTFKTVGKEIKSMIDLAKTGKGAIGNAIKGIGPLFKGAGKDIGGFASTMRKAFSTALNTARLYTGMIGGVLKQNLLKVASSVGRGLLSGGRLLLSAFKGGFKLFGTIAGTLGRTLLTVVKVACSGIMAVVRPVIAFLVANPIALVIMAIIAVVILLYTAWKHNWGGIQDKTKVVIDFIKSKIEKLPEVFEAVKTKVSEFTTAIKGYWEDVKTFFANPIQGTVNIVKNIGEKVLGNSEVTSSSEPGENALGTPYWKGGLTWVGEKGPELVELPAGSNISSNWNSMKKLGGGDIQVQVTVEGNVIGNEGFINQVGTAVYNKVSLALANI